MANRHYAKIADVWKHLPLAELLAVERPKRYLESHAGSALYPLTRSPERDYGVRWFLDHADASQATAKSAYHRLLAGLPGDGRYPLQYPGSAMLAMLQIGRNANYFLSDTDPESVASLQEGAEEVGLIEQAQIVQEDGRAAVWDEALKAGELRTWTVHIDPFDAFGTGASGGPSAVELARRMAGRGAVVCYWYGMRTPLTRRGPGRRSRRRSNRRHSRRGAGTCSWPSLKQIPASSVAVYSWPTPPMNRCVGATNWDGHWK